MSEKEKKHPIRHFWEYIKANFDVVKELSDSAALIILFLYPFRNIHKGLDLWDTGYNLANFQYIGTDSMDPMWLFSTYLSNSIGHLMTLLPYGHTLRGMNFYTAFIPAFTAVLMYLFFTRMVKLPAVLTFIAEFAALSMCWAPTAVLYHYLTYFIITLSAAALYLGLAGDRKMLLVLSGALCGLGVFVRFSNLPQFSLILAIWMYGIFEFREAFLKSDGVKIPSRVDTLVISFVRGLWFTLGYFGASFLYFLYLGFRYGFVEYVQGITDLFSISESAPSYGTKAMIADLIRSYTDQRYWVLCILVFSVAGGLVYFASSFIGDRFFGEKSGKNTPGWLKILKIAGLVLGAVFSVLLILFFMIRENPFVTFNYRSYYCVFALAGLVMFWGLAVSVVGVFFRNDAAENRLLMTLSAYCLLISAIGSNNGEFSVFNNMFFWLPCAVMMLYKLLRNTKYPWLYGLKCVITAVSIFFLIQSTLFGFSFAFSEGESGSGDPRDYIVSGNRTLKSIRMSYDKAYSLERLSGFIEERELGDRELITFGFIPGMSFYLQMEPAFNTWPDLKSYSIDKLSAQLDEILKELQNEAGGSRKPVVILNISSAESDNEAKWKLIYDFLDEGNYRQVYTDKMFVLYE